LLILTPGSLEPCTSPNDHLRREIETALDVGRNMVLLLTHGFEWSQAETQGRMRELPLYPSINFLPNHLEATVYRLLNRHLKQAVYTYMQPTPPHDQNALQHKMVSLLSLPDPTDSELAAEAHLNQGHHLALQDRLLEAEAEYSQALRLKPDYEYAFFLRGLARQKENDLTAALADYTEVRRLNPRNEAVQVEWSFITKTKRDAALKISQFNEMIQRNPQYMEAYFNRGIARLQHGDYEGAKQDYEMVLHLNPDHAHAKRHFELILHKLGG
jgi:tetratricopeptide (TPR) repeat protein